MTTRIPGRTAALAGLIALALAPAQASAQAAAPPDSLPAYLLEGVVVTTTRAPALRTSLPQRIEVVTRTDLERTAAVDVAGALKKTAAVDVIEYPGLLSGVSIRGFRPQISGVNQRTLLLLDGRPAGATNLATLDLAAVERIEVLKGPASALYGSSAMGGVVNVVTRRSSGALHGSLDASYGSFDTHRVELVAGGSLTDALDFDLALATAGRGDGYRIGSRHLLGGDSLTKVLGTGSVVRLPRFSRDTTLAFSEYAKRSGSVRLGYALPAGWRLEGRAAAFAADGVQNPGDLFAPYDSRSLSDLARRTGELGLAGSLGRHDLSVRGYASVETSAFYTGVEEPGFVGFRSPTRWRGVQLQDVATFGPHSLTVGVDHAAARAETEVFSAPGERAAPYAPDTETRSTAAFAQGRLSFLEERLTATLGARVDRVRFAVFGTDLFGGARAETNREDHLVLNPSAGLQYRLGAVRLHATAGRAFVTPDAFFVAGYSESRAGERSVHVTRGNPALDPESSVTWDAGVGLSRPALGVEADLTYFHTDVRDRITRVPPAAGSGLTARGDSVLTVATFANADAAEIRGVEATLAYDLGALRSYAHSLRLFAGATRLLRAEELAGGRAAGIRNVADLTVNAGIEFDDLERFSARLQGRYVGERLDDDYVDWMNPGTVRYPAFAVLDASARARVGERYLVGLEVENLTDESYFEVRGYNLPGRSLRLHLGVRF